MRPPPATLGLTRGIDFFAIFASSLLFSPPPLPPSLLLPSFRSSSSMTWLQSFRWRRNGYDFLHTPPSGWHSLLRAGGKGLVEIGREGVEMEARVFSPLWLGNKKESAVTGCAQNREHGLHSHHLPSPVPPLFLSPFSSLRPSAPRYTCLLASPTPPPPPSPPS